MIKHLKNDFFCVALQLDGRPELLSAIQMMLEHFPLNNPTLIGYSMGGRIALQLSMLIPKVLLSAHPGLETAEEKQERWAIDLKWIEILEKETIEVFLEKWYAQPLFASLRKKQDLFAHMLSRRQQLESAQLIAMLHQMSLAKQKKVSEFPYDTLFLFGEEDLKYEQLYCTLPQQVQRKKISHAGHALHLENPEECAQNIKQFLERRLSHANVSRTTND